MKKSILCLTLILCMVFALVGCNGDKPDPSSQGGITGNSDSKGSNSSSTPDNSSGTQTITAAKSLRFVGGEAGSFGNDSGYYYARTNIKDDKNGDPYMSMMYVDYASKKEVYLCNKSNCAHNDSGCTSHLSMFGCKGAFTYDNKLYRFIDDDANSGGAPSMTASGFVPVVYVSDLDGSNSRKLAELTSGTEWADNFVFGNGMAYVMIDRHELVQDGSGMTDRIVESNLVSINLSSGKFTKLTKTNDKEIIGAFDNVVVFSEISFTTSSGSYLERLKSANLIISTFDVSSESMKEIAKIPYPGGIVCNGSSAYYAPTGKSSITELNLKTGQSSTLADNLPSSPNIMLAYAGHVVCINSGKNGVTDFYAVNASSKAVGNINLFLTGETLKVEIDILAELSDSFLVRTGYDTKKETVDWAGVTQNSVIGEKFALISKTNYFAGKAQYSEITKAK